MLDKLDLVIEIEELLEECDNYPFNYHEDKYPCELITSPAVKSGKFSIENLLLWQGFIEPVAEKELLSNLELDIAVYEYDYPEIAQKHQRFIDFIQSNLGNRQVYKVNLEELNESDKQFEDTYFYCVIGSLAKNHWLAISPSIYHEYYYASNQQKNISNLTAQENEIIKTIESNFENSLALFLKSEDFLSNGHKVEVSTDRNLIVGRILDSTCYCWSKEFKPSPSGIGNKLGQLLVDNLSEVRQYNIWGYDGLFIYIGGTEKDGDWIGLYNREEYSY